MATVQLKNFMAANRKRNLVDFGLLPPGDYSWIKDNDTVSFSPYAVTFSATPVFELINGNDQRITLTGDMTSSTITRIGSTTAIDQGTQIFLRFIQDGTGGRIVKMPTNVRQASGISFPTDANTMLTFYLEFRSNGWDMVSAPVQTNAI